jgi:Ca2+-binding RTX toxin-like protein
MSKRSFNGLFNCLGAVSVALIAAGCSSAMSEPAEQTTSQAEELGESFSSCVAANSTTDWVSASGILTIDASANTTGTIIVSPGNGVVKVNGRTCKTSAGATIALTAVKVLNITGKTGASDTFVLDFSAGLPKAPLLQANGIVIDGGETIASTTTPDTVVVKGSTGVDPVSVGLDSDQTSGQVDISLTATSKVANVVLKKIGRKAQGPYQPGLIFSLGTGDDTFTGLGGFPAGTPSTAMNYGMSIYGGAGNDTLIGGTGSDKIIGGGQATDTLDYSARTGDVFADMDSAKVSVWGGDLRGVAMASGETITITNGSTTQLVTFASTDVTPALIASKINTTNSNALAGVASIVGNRLRLTATGGATKIVIDGGSSPAAVKLGLMGGLYESVGNDGMPGAQMALPWTAPSGWVAGTAYKVGDVIVPTTTNGYWYRATVAGAADGTTEPTWTTTLGGTITDNAVTWVVAGKTVKTGVVYSFGDVVYDNTGSAVYRAAAGSAATAVASLNAVGGSDVVDNGITWTTIADPWVLSTSYTTGDYVTKTGGAYFKALTTGTSAATAPTWPTVIGGQVVDGGVTWQYMGIAPAPAAKTVYKDGDVAYVGTRVGRAAVTSTLTSAAVSFPGTPATFIDGDILWVYAGAMAEADDVQGISVLSAGTGNDVLVGNTLANTLNGNDGNDVLSGGPLLTASSSCPTDKLNGGNGSDWFDMGSDDATSSAVTKTDCNQTVTGGAGSDVVDYSQRTAYSKVLLKLDGTTLSGEQGTTPKEGDKVGTDVEVVLGGKGDDTLTGTDNADFLFGGDGKDTIYGGKGDDHIYGGPNDDAIYGDVGSDTVYELTAYPAATAWNEPLVGGTFAGVGLAIFGSDKPGAGNDVVFGGTDLTETNKLDFTDSAAAVKVALCSDAAASNTNFGTCTSAKSDYVGVSSDGTGSTTNTYVNMQYVAGSLTSANTFIGTATAEVFEGGMGVDTILGQGGQDTLFGYADPATGFGVDNVAADILCGGDDDDVLQAGTSATTEGEGQMDAVKSSSSQVQLSGASTQATSYCTHWANTTNPYTVIVGVNLCFGGGTKKDCAN